MTSVAFEQIPLLINVPGSYVEFSTARASRGVSLMPHDALIIGQKLSAGAATAATIYAIDSEGDANVLFGTNSQVAQMCVAFKRQNPRTQLYAMGLADGGSAVSATGSFVWTGTATESRELVLYIGGVRVAVPVNKGDTAAAIETNALAQLALITTLSVTVAGNAAAGIDVTARHGGTIGNQIALGHSQLPGERVPAGISVTVTAMSSGATDPDYSAAVTAMGDDWYHTVISGLCTTTPIGLLKTELERRWGPLTMIEGQLFAALADSRANLSTFGDANNSWTFTLLGLEVSSLMPLPWQVAAAVGAESASQTQIDPARASTGVRLTGMYGARRGSRFTRAQQETLLGDGVSTLEVGIDGGLAIQRLITTYQTNALNVPDKSLRDLTSVRLLGALRYSLRGRIGTKFARFKLMDDGNPIPVGQPIVTPSAIRGEIIMLAQDWVALGWIENIDQLVEELVVVRNANDPNRVDCLLPPDLINNLLVFAAQIAPVG